MCIHLIITTQNINAIIDSKIPWNSIKIKKNIDKSYKSLYWLNSKKNIDIFYISFLISKSFRSKKW